MDWSQMPAPLPPELVREFVAVGHGDLARVQALLDEEPGLLNAAWNWGGGDWETALGAAAHVGRRDIAEFLLARGATLTIFAAAMLGKLAIVEAIVADNPVAASRPGAHGIPLIAHAAAGGAAEVVAWLESLAPADQPA